MYVCVHALSCSTLCDFMDCNSPGSSVHGILQARILSNLPPTNKNKWKKKKEYWTKLLWPPSEDFPEPGMEPASSALVGVFFTIRPPRKPWRKRWRWKIEEKNFFSNPQLSSFTFLTSKENSQINKFDSPRLTMVQLVIFFFFYLYDGVKAIHT